jgi:pimeloyl-ACP methyl ester carboxylesterase
MEHLYVGATYIAEHDCHIRYVELHGAEPARVYLAGLAGAATNQWAGMATYPALAGHRTLLVDLLGCGFSDRPKSFSYRIEDHAGTVAQVLDDMDLASCEVIGHSAGGAVAIWLAALRTSVVSKLVVLEANLDPGSGSASVSGAISKQTEEEFLTAGWATLTDMIKAQSADWAGVLQTADPYGVYWTARSLHEGTDPTAREQLYALTMPRTFIVGERSLPNPKWDDLPSHGIPTPVVLGAGHGMQRDNPDEVARVIAAALVRET